MTPSSVGIFLGTSPKSVEAAGKIILQILQTPKAENKTKVIALKTLAKMAANPTNCTISNCSVTMPPSK